MRNVDSWRNPTRGPLLKLIVPFFVKPVQQNSIMLPLALFAPIGLVTALFRRRRAALLTVGAFLPVAIASWLNFDVAAAGRYAIAYLPMHALLAAEGIDFVAAAVSRRRERAVAFVMFFAVTAVAMTYAFWTWPALRVQQTTVAPPVAALEWVVAHVPQKQKVYVWRGLHPLSRLYLDRYEVVELDENTTLPVPQSGVVTYFVADWSDVPSPAATFVRPRGRLWRIVRKRYFESSVVPVTSELTASMAQRFRK